MTGGSQWVWNIPSRNYRSLNGGHETDPQGLIPKSPKNPEAEQGENDGIRLGLTHLDDSSREHASRMLDLARYAGKLLQFSYRCVGLHYQASTSISLSYPRCLVRWELSPTESTVKGFCHSYEGRYYPYGCSLL